MNDNLKVCLLISSIHFQSGNGTFLNETQIPPLREIPIEEGDEIGIGVCQVIDPYCFVYKVVCRVSVIFSKI